MTVRELTEKTGWAVLAGQDALSREIDGIYCCDMLSIAMGRAPADSAWVTVMANVNTLAVAVLADVACVILAENVRPDDATVAKAQEQNVALLQSGMPVYETARRVESARDH